MRYYKTIDGGDSWVMYTDPATMDLYDVYFVDSNNGFISGRDGFFMRTTNGGNTWTSGNCGCEVNEMMFINGLTGFAIATEFFGDTYLVKTTNAGSSWFPAGMENIESYQFIDENTVIGTGGMGRLLKSTDAGTTYTNYSSAVTYANFVDIQFPSFETGYAVGYMGEIVKTTDAGDNWELLPQGPAPRLNGVWFTTETEGFVSGDSSLYITSDGGITWRKHQMQFPGWMTDIFFVNSTTGYLIGEGDGLIYKTTDGGDNWNLLYQDPYYWPRSIYFVSEDTGYVALETSILKTTNGGADWTETELTNTEYVLLLDIFFPTSEVGYAGGFGGKIYKTSDAGATWNELVFSETSYHTIVSIYFIDQNKGFIGGDGSGFFQTADGGNTWTKLQYMTGFHDAIWFTSNTTGYVAGSYGKIMRTSNAGAVPVIDTDKPETYCYIYPNPACTEFSITGLPQGRKSIISVYSSNGKCIITGLPLESDQKVNISNLTRGLYHVRIVSGNSVVTRNLLKL